MSSSLILRFVGFFSTVSFIVCFFTYRLLKKRLGFGSTGNAFLAVFFVVIFLLLIIGPLQFRLSRSEPSHPLVYPLQFAQYFLMGWAGVNLIVFGTLEFFQTLITLMVRPFHPSQRVFLTEGIARGALALTTGSTLVGLIQAETGPIVKRVDIKLDSLPQSFDQLKIVQISDVHIGPMLHRSFCERVVSLVNQLEPDLVFITGDVVDGSVDQLIHHIEPLKNLKPKIKSYLCTGNHEYYSGAIEWLEHFESLGIHVLKNSNEVLTRNQDQILIAGVYDFQADRFPQTGHRSDCFQAASTSAPVSCKILLAHNPHSTPDAEKAGFDLQFSGHTHAGQFYPFTFLVKAFLKYSEGLYQVSPKMQLYVNRGTGYWGPPNRFGLPGEITAITLFKSGETNNEKA